MMLDERRKECEAAWRAAREELGLQLEYEEELRLENAQIEKVYLQRFGAAHRRLVEAELRCVDLRQRLALLQTDPGLSAADLDRLMERARAERAQALHRLAGELMLAQVPDPPAALLRTDGGPDPALVAEFQRRYRTLLTELRLRTHPDKRAQYLDQGRAYTEQQLAELDQAWRLATRIHASELRYHQRSLIVLADALQRVREICELAGLDVEPGSVLRGETIEEQIEWLVAQTGRLQREIEESRDRMLLLVRDHEVQLMRQVLSAEDPERVRSQMRQRAEAMEQEAAGLQREMEELLSVEPAASGQ